MIQKWTIICKEIIDHFVAQTTVLPGSFIDGDSEQVTGTGLIT